MSKMRSPLAIDFAGVAMKNPVCTASGTFGSGYQFKNYLDLSRLGAITTKGVASVPWPGNPQPRMAEVPSGVLNSIGLQNPGAAAFAAQDGPALCEIAKDTPVIVNVAGHTLEEYVDCIKMLNELDFISLYEINISCPNLDCGGSALGARPDTAARVTQACKRYAKRPVMMKLTPNTGDIAAVGYACQEAGADALSLINTIPAMAIDLRTKRSRLSKPTAGLSGPAIHAIALRMVWETAQRVNIPIMALGGIASWQDAAEFIVVGAQAVSVGTQNLIDPHCAEDIVTGLEDWVHVEGVSHISELVGCFRV